MQTTQHSNNAQYQQCDMSKRRRYAMPKRRHAMRGMSANKYYAMYGMTAMYEAAINGASGRRVRRDARRSTTRATRE